ncbi:hypothetical protein KFK09_027734 [Dendrobium nobile]|uniref:Dentin sialophosphoprotein-like n=1 Tax=Dendrobium nobile TaxID=94219 RepID=A0A8T3A1D2_DENNO|nr:hypothetical protein KFK09_027734 [Dendrobium nobile]
MFHHSSNRNHRPQGSNVKKILQVVVLLAVACWLLYQVKHSRDKKTEYVGNDEKKLSKGGEEIYLGRKGDAGSENVIIIDTNGQGSDESTEIKQDEIQHNSSHLNSDDTSNEIPQNHEQEDSKESIMNNGEKESTQEEHVDSHANDGEEILHLPSEREKSSDQNESTDGGSTHEENDHLKKNGVSGEVKSDWIVGDKVESTMTGEETTSISGDQTVSSENVGKENEQENGEASNQEVVSMDDETNKGEELGSDDENIRSLSKASDDNKIDQADVGERFDDEHVSSHAGDSVEFNIDTSLQNGNEASKEKEIETKLEKAAEVENTDNNSSGEIKIDGESEKEIENSSSNTEVQNSNDASNVSVESQSDKTSDTEGTANVDNGQETSSEVNNNEIVDLQTNNEDAKVETDSERRDAGDAGNFENNSVESTEEIEKSSEGAEQSGSDNGKSDDVTGSDPGNKISGTGHEDHIAHKEEGKNDVVSSDEAITSDDSTNEISAGEAVQTEGGNISEAESINHGNTETVKTVQSSDVETKQDNTNSSAAGEASEEKVV